MHLKRLVWHLAGLFAVTSLSSCGPGVRGGGGGDDDDGPSGTCDGGTWFEDDVPIEDIVFCPEPGSSVSEDEPVMVRNETQDDASCLWGWTNVGQFAGQFTLAAGEQVDVGPLADLEFPICLWGEVPEFWVSCGSTVPLGSAAWTYPSGLPDPADCPALLLISNSSDVTVRFAFRMPNGYPGAEEIVTPGATTVVRSDQNYPFEPGVYPWVVFDENFLESPNYCDMPDANLDWGSVFEATVSQSDVDCE